MATIVSFHAHPDDEALLTGGWLARRASAGDRVVLVFATDGDAGLAARSVGSLGRLRRTEAEASARALNAARLVWLDYADSGMAGDPTTSARRFVDAPVGGAARALSAILDEEQADILTGYDRNGGYGHPDHLQLHRVARRARELARHRPRLLEATRDRTRLRQVVRAARPFGRLLPGLTLPPDDIYVTRSELSLTIDVRDQLEAKCAALAAHASQRTGGIRTVAILLALPRPLRQQLLGTEWFCEVP